MKLIAHPPTSKILLDGKEIPPSGRVVELPAGPHRIQVWAHSWTYMDTIFQVQLDTTLRFFGRLRRDTGYYAYRDELKSYKWKKAKVAGGFIIAPSAVIVGVILDKKARGNMATSKELAERRREEYEREFSPDRVQYARNQFEIARNVYTKNYRLRWANAGIGVAAVGGSVYMIVRNLSRLKGENRPVYKQKDPLAHLEFDGGLGPQGTWVSGITIKF